MDGGREGEREGEKEGGREGGKGKGEREREFILIPYLVVGQQLVEGNPLHVSRVASRICLTVWHS